MPRLAKVGQRQLRHDAMLPPCPGTMLLAARLIGIEERQAALSLPSCVPIPAVAKASLPIPSIRVRRERGGIGDSPPMDLSPISSSSADLLCGS